MFACDGDVVEPLAPFAIPNPTLWCWSDDWTHVLAVDQERKRASTFRLEGETFEPTMSPRTLPKGINAHCVAMKGDQPYVGAQSVWLPVDDRGWQQIPMPGFARGEGKRLDGLIIDGDRLVAVDDLLLPKPSATGRDASTHDSSAWDSAPLAFALLPALGGMLFTNGSSVITDVMLLGLAAIFLNWSVRLPW